jgi:hypothetical protein
VPTRTIKRLGIPKSIRFEVFKRDSFKCQYCGESAPDVILEIDHIHPVSKDGDQRDITNLITSCRGCNSGKSDRLLSDATVAKKRKRQLDDLQERREQIEMMADWQRGLADLDGQALRECARLFDDLSGWTLTECGLSSLRKTVKQFGMTAVMEAVRTSCSRYLRASGARSTQDSASEALSKIGGICYLSKQARDNPNLAELYRIRAMLRSRCGGFSQWQDYTSLSLLRSALDWGCSPEQIRRGLAGLNRWWEIHDRLEELLTTLRENANG